MNFPDLEYEKEAWLIDSLICGVDEVGRGCLAGPVVAAAVVLPKNHKPITGIRDSKKISVKKRELLFDEILKASCDFGIGLVSAKEVDDIGIVQATKKAMTESINSLLSLPEIAIIDAVILENINLEQKNITKGDEKCYSVACASIIAKVFRDRTVSGLDNIFPNHGFSSHKGYGTKAHYEAIKNYGLTPEHRRSFLKSLSSNV